MEVLRAVRAEDFLFLLEEQRRPLHCEYESALSFQSSVYLRVPPASKTARRRESLEIQKNIHGALACVCLQPMADVIVMHRQFAEDLLLMPLQFCQQFLELCLVENITGGDRPRGMQLSLGGRRNPSKNHFAEAILRAFLDGHGIGNCLCLLIVRG